MTDVLVGATLSHAVRVRGMLATACRATGMSIAVDVFSSGSLYQRLRARRASPMLDLLLWSNPYAAHAAAQAGLLRAHQPAALSERAQRHPEWYWPAAESQSFRVIGQPPTDTFQELASVPRLAVADPERSEVGTMLLLASLDRARQIDGDAELAWTWWARRVQSGIRLADDDPTAFDTVRRGRATHAAGLAEQGSTLGGLAPVPLAVSLSAGAPNIDAARRLFDWLVSQDTTGSVAAAMLDVAPPLDIDWGTQQYNTVRTRWAQSGYSPAVEVQP
jgi:ABC-type Fe3+ transport system substrate-binding protein